MTLQDPPTIAPSTVWRAATVAVCAALVAGALIATPASAAPPRPVDPLHPDFGPNVQIFSPDTPLGEIQAALDSLADKQRDAEMSEARHAVYFLPGEYGTDAAPLQFEVGYYTEIAGLGAQPTDVSVDGKLEVYNRCLAGGGTSNCIALVNFWRTLSNLSINVNASGRSGRHLVYVIWQASHADQSYYFCSDVNFS